MDYNDLDDQQQRIPLERARPTKPFVKQPTHVIEPPIQEPRNQSEYIRPTKPFIKPPVKK